MYEKVIIFDFDGVILDSVDIKTSAFRDLFKKQTEKIQKKIINYHKINGGISRIKKFEYFYKVFLKKKITNKIKKDLSNKFNRIVYKKILKCKFIKGADKFIKKNKDYHLFISSGTPEKELKLICKKRGISKYFKEIYGSPKSKVDHIKKIQKKLKKADLFIFIGDSKNDYDAAMKTKIKFIQVGNNIKNKTIIENKIKTLEKLNFFLKKI